MSWYQKKHSPCHTYRGHQSPLICFIHLIRPWHPPYSVHIPDNLFSTVSLQVFFDQPLGLAPSTSYSIHFFTQIIVFFLQQMAIPSHPVFTVVPRLCRLIFLAGQVSLQCNILLCTQLLYNLPLTINDISLLVSNGTNCLNLFLQFEFSSPQLHQHLHPHSTCHLNNKTYPLTPDLH